MPSHHFPMALQFPFWVPHWPNPTGSHKSLESIGVVHVSQLPKAESRWRKREVALEGQMEVTLHTVIPQCLEDNLKRITQRTQTENNLT